MIIRRAALLALLWALAILVLTLMPSSGVPRWPWAAQIHLDKLVHAFLFGVQGVLLGLALANWRTWSSPAHPFLLALMIAILYGAVIELLQEGIGAGRHGDIWDLAADGVGALLGYGFLRWWQWRKA
ncbi:MAG: VanZ family protein [Flavobacteriales bacterium]|nr:VanZ family protein [Flavobacteriales bacterium]